MKSNISVLHSLQEKGCKKNCAKKSLNVPNVKIVSKKNFNVFGSYMPFYWEWQLAPCILSDFPGIRSLSGLNDLNSLNNLSGLNDLGSLISSKNLLNLMFPSTLAQNDLSWSFNVGWIIKNTLFYWFLALFLLEAVEDRDVTFNQIQGSIVKCPLPMNIQITFVLRILSSKTL